ncbi:uncharacterized protein ISCGN_027838 [Ixodes scapularis]
MSGSPLYTNGVLTNKPALPTPDNGPPFQSHEFARFMASYGIVHQTSGPNFPQSNGEAERMVRTVKNLLRKAHDPCLALLNYRDTPGPSGFSPAQLLMGRRLRTRLPKEGRLLVPSSKPLEEVATKAAKLKRRQVTDFDRRHRARSLSPLEDGQAVKTQLREKRLKVWLLLKNRRHLQRRNGLPLGNHLYLHLKDWLFLKDRFLLKSWWHLQLKDRLNLSSHLRLRATTSGATNLTWIPHLYKEPVADEEPQEHALTAHDGA